MIIVVEDDGRYRNRYLPHGREVGGVAVSGGARRVTSRRPSVSYFASVRRDTVGVDVVGGSRFIGSSSNRVHDEGKQEGR